MECPFGKGYDAWSGLKLFKAEIGKIVALFCSL